MGSITKDNVQFGNCCYLCTNDITISCGRIGCRVGACSPLHLQLHWTNNGECAPFETRFHTKAGRILVAGRTIQEGELIVEDHPLVVGPNQEGSAICISCLAACDSETTCKGCGYPVCDEECAEDGEHSSLECCILSNPKFSPRFESDKSNKLAYQAILPLRLLLLKEKRPDLFQHAMEFMDHGREREGTEAYELTQKHVVRFLKVVCAQIQWSEELINKVVGILETNCFELHSYPGVAGTGYRAMFPVLSIMSHFCNPNTSLTFDKESPYCGRLFASRTIEKGEQITTSYLPALASNIGRRRRLQES